MSMISIFTILEYVPLKLKISGTIILIFFLYRFFILRPSRKVYLVDYACFLPKKSQSLTREEAITLIKALNSKSNTNEIIQLQQKMIMSSGIGDSTYVPESFRSEPPELTMEGARREAEAAIYGVIDALFAKTGVSALDVGVLIVNCCIFNPNPSLSSMIVNKYKLKDDIKSFSLSGMGCSASLIAIGLAKQLLQVHENTCAMIVSIEVLSESMYMGKDCRKLAGNSLFRVGGAAILLSNRPSDRHSSEYQLMHTVHTNTASSDSSYKCIFREEDTQGMEGLNINKDIVLEAAKAIKAHLMTVGYLILPKLDRLIFLLNYLIRKLCLANLKPYSPNFGCVVDHFFTHVGGRTVIDELEKHIKLDVEAARMTLYRFGNTSSSSVWYELAYAEARGKIEKGHRIWQIAFGSGFKCNSVIWRALKNVSREKNNPWDGEIDDYPIKLETFKPVPIFFEQAK